VDIVVSASTLGLLGGLVVLLTFFGRIPPWLGYPIGGGLLSIYVLILVVGLKASREFRKVKIEGAYWKAYCNGCAPGDVVEVVRVGDAGVEVRRVG